MSPDRLTCSLGQYLYDRLTADLGELDARGAWVREEARDTTLFAFFAQQELAETRRAVLPDGMEVVIMGRWFVSDA